MNEDEIIAGCKNNDRRAQKALYENTCKKMYAVALSYMKDEQDAQDILHDAYIKVFNRIETFNNSANIEGWIRRIVSNTAIDRIRKDKRMTRSDFIENEELGNYCNIAAEIQNADLNSIINLLPDGARIIFNLHVLEGYKHHEIAEKLGINEGTSKSQFFRAKKILQELVQLHYPVG